MCIHFDSRERDGVGDGGRFRCLGHAPPHHPTNPKKLSNKPSARRSPKTLLGIPKKKNYSTCAGRGKFKEGRHTTRAWAKHFSFTIIPIPNDRQWSPRPHNIVSIVDISRPASFKGKRYTGLTLP